MTLELERTGPTVPPEVIDQFEQSLGARLPMDYRHFLVTVNGGWATTDFHHPPSADGDFGIDCLWGVGVDDENRSLEKALGVFQGPLPA